MLLLAGHSFHPLAPLEGFAVCSTGNLQLAAAVVQRPRTRSSSGSQQSMSTTGLSVGRPQPRRHDRR
jgi:hypothetical protein